MAVIVNDWAAIAHGSARIVLYSLVILAGCGGIAMFFCAVVYSTRRKIVRGFDVIPSESRMVIGVNHFQVNVPTDDHARARDFYLGFLGFKEIHRPDVFKSGGTWMNAGTFEVHIGLEDGVERKTRAHIAYQVTDIAAWRKKVADAGYKIVEQPKIPNYERFHFRDPFGNNIELIQRTEM